jgi:molecular chaperone DnaJ
VTGTKTSISVSSRASSEWSGLVNNRERVAFHTLGCKVNQEETASLMEMFRKRGFQLVDFKSPADVYIINTCTVTHTADQKSRQMNIELSFKEAAFGVEREVTIQRWEDCGDCGGSGAAPGTEPVTCYKCGGTGQVRVTQRIAFGQFSTVTTCDNCKGTGKTIEKPCNTCHGKGKVRRPRKVNIKVPAGVDNGSALRLAGEGELGTQGGPPGDLIVRIRVRPHKVFKREKDNVVMEVPISFVQAALGDEIEIPTLDGNTKFRIPEGTQPNAVFHLRGKGIPHLQGYGRGDQILNIKVVIPTKLTENQKEMLQKFDTTVRIDQYQTRKGFFEKVKDAFIGG